jgi:hypothetical protein
MFLFLWTLTITVNLTNVIKMDLKELHSKKYVVSIMIINSIIFVF